ncbi:MAG: preprotein translocase subunit SecY, partial [Clostridiales bacterium]|nr:preprotein translocase subunit SecY [Clostridiales bacterium]
MIQTVVNAWKIPELKRKMIFVIFALLIFRLGSAIPVPFIDGDALQTQLAAASGTIFGLINVMSGDAFARATVFALSIQPYINSSIIIQLLTVAIPALERLAKDGGEEGRKKIASITRYVTVAIALLQSWGYYSLIKSYGLINVPSGYGVWAAVVIIASFTAGSAFLMWLGEQITEFGVGNGISIILFAGIVSRVPSMVVTLGNGARASIMGVDSIGSYSAVRVWAVPLLVIGMILLIMLIVFVNDAERRIPV